MKLYTFSITDINGDDIIHYNRKCISAKQAAFLATQEVNHIPPAMGFNIHVIVYTASDIAKLLNEPTEATPF
jgi:hypothetical protein